MEYTQKKLVCNAELRLEAYRFTGLARPFPQHFHDYYVLGLIEGGERRLLCRGREYAIGPGDLLLFGPGDSHACTQSDGSTLDYRALNISRETMNVLMKEIAGEHTPLRFLQNVLHDEEAACCLRALREQVMQASSGFGKEEALLLLLALLSERCGQIAAYSIPSCTDEVKAVCAFMERHYAEHISLEQLCRCVGLSKSALLRAFAREKGMTPYRYLENIRVGRAKELLERGVLPCEAALRTGFSDQSHLTNYFSCFLGLPPGIYREMFRSGEEGTRRP